MRLLAAIPTGAAAAILTGILAVPAGAAPDCSDIGPNTRMCSGPGHAAIVTSPDPAFTNPWPGWGFGTLGIPAIAFGGNGLWVGM